jgi:hypothetical protein
MRLLFIIICAAVATTAAYFFQPFMNGNSEAITIVITIFTVFAGFLIAVIAVLGDPALIPQGSWRIAENRRNSIETKLFWHFWLFILYLLTIGLLFVGALLKDTKTLVEFRVWIERGYLFFGVFSFFLTFALPWSVMQMQKDRIDAEIERRRAQSGINGEGGKQEE